MPLSRTANGSLKPQLPYCAVCYVADTGFWPQSTAVAHPQAAGVCSGDQAVCE